jgi:hypothetical protein
MTNPWVFDPRGPDFRTLHGPVPLASRRLGLPAKPGLYIVTCGDCMPHVGTSNSIAGRVRTLANLGTHRGSAEVLCAAYCTGEAPVIWWEEQPTPSAARERELAFKTHYGEPPQPRSSYERCVNGRALLNAIIEAAGPDSWEAGFAEAVFLIGEKLSLLFGPRFTAIWKQVGEPPGPWRAGADPERQWWPMDA